MLYMFGFAFRSAHIYIYSSIVSLLGGLVIYAKDSNEFLWIGGNREYETGDK